jgi:uncharacterized OsmC-like protein
MDRHEAAVRFEVIFDVEGRNAAKFRNEIVVHKRLAHPVSVELPTDEGPGHGGDGTAPYPLAYFASGLTACLMTQLRAFSRRLGIEVGEFSVNARCHWEGRQIGAGPYESAPIAFTMEIDLGDALSEADKRRLVEAAAKGCFVEQALKPGIVRHRLKHGGAWIEI